MSAHRTRRELLAAGARLAPLGAAGAGAAALVFPAAAGAARTPHIQKFPMPVFDETDRLQRLIRLELLLLYCYRSVLGAGILNHGAQVALATFPAHEEAHVGALEQRLRARGGAVPPGPASHAQANRYLAHRGVGGRLGQLKGPLDAVRLLLTLEQVTIGAYNVALTGLQNTDLVELICQIVANEAQHDAMLGMQLPPFKPAAAAPYGLVSGLQ
jgi:hypothetical protein